MQSRLASPTQAPLPPSHDTRDVASAHSTPRKMLPRALAAAAHPHSPSALLWASPQWGKSRAVGSCIKGYHLGTDVESRARHALLLAVQRQSEAEQSARTSLVLTYIWNMMRFLCMMSCCRGVLVWLCHICMFVLLYNS
jgi:hypothetical protein